MKKTHIHTFKGLLPFATLIFIAALAPVMAWAGVSDTPSSDGMTLTVTATVPMVERPEPQKRGRQPKQDAPKNMYYEMKYSKQGKDMAEIKKGFISLLDSIRSKQSGITIEEETPKIYKIESPAEGIEDTYDYDATFNVTVQGGKFSEDTIMALAENNVTVERNYEKNGGSGQPQPQGKRLSTEQVYRKGFAQAREKAGMVAAIHGMEVVGVEQIQYQESSFQRTQQIYLEINFNIQ